jgi:hypothetical protein
MSLHFILPESARVSKYLIQGDRTRPVEGADGAHLMVFSDIIVPRNAARTVTIGYRLSNVLDGDALRFALVPQTTVRADRYQISFDAPGGQEMFDPQKMTGASSVTYGGRLEAPVEFNLRLVDAS